MILHTFKKKHFDDEKFCCKNANKYEMCEPNNRNNSAIQRTLDEIYLYWMQRTPSKEIIFTRPKEQLISKKDTYVAMKQSSVTNERIDLSEKQGEDIKAFINCLNSLIDDDIIITNQKFEYHVPDMSKIQSITDNDDFSTIYDVCGYCNTEIELNHQRSGISNLKYNNKEWEQYLKTFPFVEVTPKILIADNIIGYHLLTVAMSHIIRKLDKYQPFQISMGIIADKIKSINQFPIGEIDVNHVLKSNHLHFVQHTLKVQSINEIIASICDHIWNFNKCETMNKRLIVLFEKIKVNVFQKHIQCSMYIYDMKASPSNQLNLSPLIPTIHNNHPKLFIINTHYIHSRLIKCYFMCRGGCLRFFPEHMETVWPHYFNISAKSAVILTRQHKYRHQFGLPLPDQRFCTIYYAVSKRR
eukprot:522884_1